MLSSRDEDSPAVQSKFVKIVNQFMNIWAGKRIHSLTFNCVLGEEEHHRDIERWIAKAVRMKVEDLDLSISLASGPKRPKYLFPCTLIQHESAPYLKGLCLRGCTLSFFEFGFTSLLSNLTSLEFCSVPLDHTWMDLILSAGTNLLSLEVHNCDLSKYVWTDGQLLRLKKLCISGTLLEVNLNCPSLEEFEYRGTVGSMRFVHVPVLREAKFWTGYRFYYCSLLFNHVNIQAPNLQTLSLWIETELARFSLKELHIVPSHQFDLASVSNLLNACPCLETLQVEMCSGNWDIATGKGEYRDQSHYKLKKMKIVRFYEKWNAMELAKYVLRNAVVLEEMLILTRKHKEEQFECLQQLQKEVNPTAQVIISHALPFV